MLHRRDAMIRLGQAGLGALTLPGLLRAEQAAKLLPAKLPAAGAKAKSCILLYLWGGLEAALWGSAAFVAITWLLTLRLAPMPVSAASFLSTSEAS